MAARKKRTSPRTAFAWTVWLIAAAAFAYLLFRFVLPQNTPLTDTPEETQPSAAFPADLAVRVTAENAIDFHAWQPCQAAVYHEPYALYPGDFSADEPSLTDERWVIVIDPGHQSVSRKNDIWLSPYLDPQNESSWVRQSPAKIGTQGSVSKIYEYEITDRAAKKLKSALERRGFTVYLTKDDVDTVMTGPERAAVSNRYQADLVISLHCDGHPTDRTARGCTAQTPAVYGGYPDARLADLSSLAGELILDAYSRGTGMASRGVQKITDSSAFNWSRSPSVLLEMGFLTNEQDERLLISDSFQDTAVEAIADGVTEYLCRAYAGTIPTDVPKTEGNQP